MSPRSQPNKAVLDVHMPVELWCDVMLVTVSVSYVSVLNEADQRNSDKSCLSLENELRLLLSRLDVLNVIGSREFCYFSCYLMTICHTCSTVLTVTG